jgi:hypothetical protein
VRTECLAEALDASRRAEDPTQRHLVATPPRSRPRGAGSGRRGRARGAAAPLGGRRRLRVFTLQDCPFPADRGTLPRKTHFEKTEPSRGAGRFRLRLSGRPPSNPSGGGRPLVGHEPGRVLSVPPSCRSSS